MLFEVSADNDDVADVFVSFSLENENFNVQNYELQIINILTCWGNCDINFGPKSSATFRIILLFCKVVFNLPNILK